MLNLSNPSTEQAFGIENNHMLLAKGTLHKAELHRINDQNQKATRPSDGKHHDRSKVGDPCAGAVY